MGRKKNNNETKRIENERMRINCLLYAVRYIWRARDVTKNNAAHTYTYTHTDQV